MRAHLAAVARLDLLQSCTQVESAAPGCGSYSANNCTRGASARGHAFQLAQAPRGQGDTPLGRRVSPSKLAFSRLYRSRRENSWRAAMAVFSWFLQTETLRPLTRENQQLGLAKQEVAGYFQWSDARPPRGGGRRSQLAGRASLLSWLPSAALQRHLADHTCQQHALGGALRPLMSVVAQSVSTCC